jgi:hypothetical protein
MSIPSTTTAPYAPSWLNGLFAAVERLPGGGWWVYPLSFVALVAYYNVALWITGSRPVGALTIDGIAAVVYGPYMVAASHYFSRVAGRAIEVFRPASGLSDADYALRRYELVTLPRGRLWLPLLIGAIIGVGSILSASAEAIAPYGGTRLTALVVLGPAAIFGYGMALVVSYQAIRQLREVDRLHREATAIDLFDTAPIYAFSGLSMRIGSGAVFAVYYALVANSAFQTGNAFSIVVIAGAIPLSVACFIVPLWGIHGRLTAEKDVLVRGVNLRAQAVQEELYRRVDASNLVGVKDVTDALVGIHATRQQIDKLPTWPWPPQVLRGFVSAILLPVVVFLITRYAGGLIR